MSTIRPKRLVDRALTKVAVQLGIRLERAREAIGQAGLPTFSSDAPGLVIQAPYEIRHPDRIHLGRDVKLGPNSVLKPTIRYPGGWLRHPSGEHIEQRFDPTLRIGDRVTATAALHIAVFENVTIEDDVMFASNVFIADGTHATLRGDVPYKYQGIGDVSSIRIGRGAFIGQNVVIAPGVTIGSLAIIGANSVVTKDVPAACVAVGAPARVIKRWDPGQAIWIPYDAPEPSGANASDRTSAL